MDAVIRLGIDETASGTESRFGSACVCSESIKTQTARQTDRQTDRKNTVTQCTERQMGWERKLVKR